MKTKLLSLLILGAAKVQKHLLGPANCWLKLFRFFLSCFFCTTASLWRNPIVPQFAGFFSTSLLKHAVVVLLRLTQLSVVVVVFFNPTTQICLLLHQLCSIWWPGAGDNHSLAQSHPLTCSCWSEIYPNKCCLIGGKKQWKATWLKLSAHYEAEWKSQLYWMTRRSAGRRLQTWASKTTSGWFIFFTLQCWSAAANLTVFVLPREVTQSAAVSQTHKPV